MKIVVGLGNPGRKYERTRHNIGFDVLDELARRFGSGSARAKFQGEVVEAMIGGEKTLLLCPHTFMNRSGQSVVAARDFYKLKNNDVLVICDDLNLPVAKLRTRAKGSAGGQNGLKDIINRLGGEDFPRMRVGIGAPPEGWDTADYVLGKFSKQEQEEVNEVVSRAADAVETWVRDGLDTCMNRFN